MPSPRGGKRRYFQVQHKKVKKKTIDIVYNPVGRIAEKSNLKECVFVNSALNTVQCYIVKNTLLHTAFSAILPSGNELTFTKISAESLLTNALVSVIVVVWYARVV